MYHRINTLRPDPWTTCVSPANFEQHLQVIRRLPVPATITFDDGYADNFENALPLLEKYDLTATVFVTSGMVGSPFEMWWDELDRKYLGQTGPSWDWDDPDPDQGTTRYREAFHRYRQNPFPIFADRPPARPERRMMAGHEVTIMANGGVIEIGAHTVTHPVLTQLALPEQRAEIEGSKHRLEEITGRPVTQFAYPNGDYSADTVALVRNAGFHLAYAASELPQSDPFQKPRVMVRDWNGDVFAAELHAKLSR